MGPIFAPRQTAEWIATLDHLRGDIATALNQLPEVRRQRGSRGEKPNLSSRLTRSSRICGTPTNGSRDCDKRWREQKSAPSVTPSMALFSACNGPWRGSGSRKGRKATDGRIRL